MGGYVDRVGASARRTTAQDVADLAGVSRSSVSLVLNGHGDGNISPEKQRTILEAAQALGYRPNAVALSLRSQRSHSIGVLTWPGRSGLCQHLLRSAWQSAMSAGFLVIIMDTDGDADAEARAVSTLLDRQVDGFLVVAPELTLYRPPEAIAGHPTLLLNCLDPDVAVTSVVPDEAGAGAAAASLLVESGHTRVGLITGQEPTEQTRLRAAGVQMVLAEAGLTPQVAATAGRDVAAGFTAARDLLSGEGRPTSLVCTHERLALGALLAAHDLGLRVPADLSLVSLEDGERLAGELRPALVTVQRPDQLMAEQAMALLLKQLTEEGEAPPQQLTATCSPRPGDSLAPPASVGSARR